MGHESIVYGRIRSARFHVGHDAALQRHNRAVVAALPEDDDWPFLTRAMFAVPGATADDALPRDGRYRSEVIHFGAAFKQVELAWDAWLAKFEALLARLHFDDAIARLQTDFLDADQDYVYRWEALPEPPEAIEARHAAVRAGRAPPWPTLPRPWRFTADPDGPPWPADGGR